MPDYPQSEDDFHSSLSSLQERGENKPSRIWRFAFSLDGISISLSKLIDAATKAGVVFNRLILLGLKILFSLFLLYVCGWLVINIAKLF